MPKKNPDAVTTNKRIRKRFLANTPTFSCKQYRSDGGNSNRNHRPSLRADRLEIIIK